MVDHGMAELETCRSGLPITEEGMIAEDIHGVVHKRVACLGKIYKHSR